MNSQKGLFAFTEAGTIQDIKDLFQEWSGFSLESISEKDILQEINSRQADLENELNQQRKIMESIVKSYFKNRV